MHVIGEAVCGKMSWRCNDVELCSDAARRRRMRPDPGVRQLAPRAHPQLDLFLSVG